MIEDSQVVRATSGLSKFSESLSTILPRLPQAVIFFDEQLAINYANPAAADYFGQTVSRLRETNMIELVSPGYTGNFHQNVSQFFADSRNVKGSGGKIMTSVIKKAGRNLPTQATILLITSNDGRPHILLRIDYEPTLSKNHATQKHLEAAAASSEIINALSNLDDAVIIFDDKWRYQYVKKKRSEILGQNVWKFRPSLKGTKWKENAYEAMATQQVLQIDEFFPELQKWFVTKFYPTPHSLVAQIRDITDFKRAEQMNNQLMGTLEEAMEVYWSDEFKARKKKPKKP
jgi:PAS domain S-box-containing protein